MGATFVFVDVDVMIWRRKNIALTLVKIPGNIGTYMLVTFHMKYYNTIKQNTKWIKFLRCRLWFVYDIKINYKTDWYVQIKRLMYFLRNKNKIPFWLIYSNIIHLIQSIMPPSLGIWMISVIYTSVDTEMCCPKGKCGCQYYILLT